MLGLIQEAGNQVAFWPQSLESWARVATPVLVAIGGVFAWFKFFRQGKHDLRLQPTVTATTEVRGDGDKVVCVFVTVTVQNPGQVEGELVPKESALTLHTTALKDDDWRQQPHPINVFVGQERIRPGETLEDQKLIQIEYANEIAVRLDLTVTAKEKLSGIRTWDTIEIVPIVAEEGGKSEQSG